MFALDERTSKPGTEFPKLDWIVDADEALEVDKVPTTIVDPYLTKVM